MIVIRVNVTIENPLDDRKTTSEAIIDTGTSYTVIPQVIDNELKLPNQVRQLR